MFQEHRRRTDIEGRPQARGIKPTRIMKYLIPKDAKIDYKNLPLIQKFITDRGKVVPRRVTGVSSKEQRELARALKRAQFLALVPVGSTKRR